MKKRYYFTPEVRFSTEANEELCCDTMTDNKWHALPQGIPFIFTDCLPGGHRVGCKWGVLISAAMAGGSETQFHCDPGICKSTLKEDLSQCELKVARCDQAKGSRAAS